MKRKIIFNIRIESRSPTILAGMFYWHCLINPHISETPCQYCVCINAMCKEVDMWGIYMIWTKECVRTYNIQHLCCVWRSTRKYYTVNVWISISVYNCCVLQVCVSVCGWLCLLQRHETFNDPYSVLQCMSVLGRLKVNWRITPMWSCGKYSRIATRRPGFDYGHGNSWSLENDFLCVGNWYSHFLFSHPFFSPNHRIMFFNMKR